MLASSHGKLGNVARDYTRFAHLLVMILLTSCGGGGGVSTTPVQVSINWGARSRDIQGPGSALSAVIVIKDASPTATNFVWIVSRDSNPAAHRKTYTSSDPIRAGTWNFTVQFHAAAGGTGDIVGLASGTAVISGGSSKLPDISTSGTVVSVSIPAGQTVLVGSTTDLVVGANDSYGNIVAVSPGTPILQVKSGAAFLSIVNGSAVGQAVGTATVAATVDGVTSAAQTVAVTPRPGAINGIYVADGGNRRLVKFLDMGGSGWQSIGIPSVDAGQFSQPQGAAVAPDGSIYIADTGNSRIVRISRFGGSIATYGSPGSGVGQFNGLNGIAVDAQGRVYIADRNNSRIVRIDDITGAGWTVMIGSPGGERLKDPAYVAVDADGAIYVSDLGRYYIFRVTGMDGAGWARLGGFGLPGAIAVDANRRIYTSRGAGVIRFDDISGRGMTTSSVGGGKWIAIDAQNRVYGTSDSSVSRVDDMSGAGLVTFGTSGQGTGQFYFPAGVAVGGGKVYVVDSVNDRLVRMDDMQGAGWAAVSRWKAGFGEFRWPVSTAVDSQGRIYVADSAFKRIVRMDDASGAGWTTLEIGEGTVIAQSWDPAFVAVDSRNRIYFADGGRIIRLDDITGSGRKEFDTRNTPVGTVSPVGIAIGPNDQIYILDRSGPGRIVRMDDMAGAGIKGYGYYVEPDFNHPTAIAVDALGRAYVADTFNHRIVRIDNEYPGGWVAKGVPGQGIGQFQRPEGVFVGPDNRIYVSDYNWIIRFDDMTGSGWTRFGSLGSGPRQFSYPRGLVVK